MILCMKFFEVFFKRDFFGETFFAHLTLIQVVEEYFIIHLEKFLIENNIINKNHHGGRKGHSTITALNQILNIA